MKTVLVFKTSVSTPMCVNQVTHRLNKLMHENERWNFDLEDCDNILRVEVFQLTASNIEEEMKKAGFMCAELPD